jgi:hypothetical protein
MTNKEIYETLGISKKAFYNYVKLKMPKNLDGAREWLKEREILTTSGSGKIIIGGREYTKEDLLDLRGKILELTAREKSSKVELQEFELAKRKGELVPKSELLQTLQTILEPLSKMLEELPNKLASNVNPDNPELAYKVLEEEIQNIFIQIQKQKDNNVR